MSLKRPSMLHVLLGQEVIYFVMAASLFAALVLAILVLRLAAAADQPPIITLEESKGYFFDSGSAALSPEFRAKLKDEILPTLVQRSLKYNAPIVEVIGHTDEQPMGAVGTTLDAELLPFLYGTAETARPPIAADNAGLGMARAAAVARALRRDSRASSLTVLPYSAGQTITTEDRLAEPAAPQSEEVRRRIEIRLRRRPPAQ